ncbi:hypothetical protein V8F06_003637 [Rhypophila decipiens]
MASGNEFRMPGAYTFDSGAGPGHPLSAGIFRPPISPSASSYNLAKSTGSLYSDISMSTSPIHATGTTKRKRMSTRESTPIDWNMNMDGAHDEKSLGRAAAGRQIRYTLAGQINATPMGAPTGVENGILEESVYSDVDYRRALGPREAHDELESPSSRFAENNAIPDQPSSPRSLGWSSFAFSTIGEVVGRVLEFCKNGVFRGFHAGGGDGYDINGAEASRTEKVWCNEHDVPTLQTEQPQPVQGHFLQQSDYTTFTPQSPVFHEMSTPDPSPRPAIKRRQVSENDELRRNWVMVDDEPQDGQPRIFGAPIQKAPAPRTSFSRARNSGVGYYSQTAASSGRRINVPVSRAGGSSTLHTRSSLASFRISHGGSSHLASREPASTASFAQQRSPTSFATPSRIPIPVPSQPTPSPTHHGTPNRFEALGTTVEVFDDGGGGGGMSGGGWEDDD